MMKSKITKIQEILMKGIAILLIAMFGMTPVAYAASSLDDSYLEGSFLNKLLYGTIGSTAKEIEEYLTNHATLYIMNETQLRAFGEYVNNGHDCDENEVILLNDIVVDSSKEWVPIGNENKRFKGNFDGQGYTISGVNFNRNNKLDSEITNIGLFGYIEGSTIIKNIIISNSKFDIPYDISSDILYESTDIENMEYANNSTTFTPKYKNLGGIVGYNNGGTIENCTIDRNVTISGMSYVGGIAGVNYKGKIENCTNNGSVNGFSCVGGISGGTWGQSDENIKLNDNIINFSDKEVSKIINCNNTSYAQIYSLIGAAGGISGSLSNNAIIQKSTNRGSVNCATEATVMNISGQKESYDPQNIGGIVGYVTGGIYNDSKNNATRINYVATDGCINFGKVRGYKDVGGIAGQLGGVGGGYAILGNCINYSLDVESTMNEAKQAGYLAGEVGSKGKNSKDTVEATSDDAIAILYNNFYVLDKKVLDKINAPNEDQLAEDDTATNSEYKNDLTNATDLEYATKALNCDTELNNESGSGYNLGYGYLVSYKIGETTYTNYTDINKSTSIILKTDSDYYAILDRSSGATKYYTKKLSNNNYFFSGPYKFNFISTESNNGTDYDLQTNSLKIKLDSSINAFKIDGKIWKLNNSNSEYILDSASGTTVTYTVSKKANGSSSYTTINKNAYFGTGDTVKVEIEFNKTLYNGSLNGSTISYTPISVPSISVGGHEMSVRSMTSGKKYEATYVVQSDDTNEKLNNISISLEDDNVYTSSNQSDNLRTKTKDIDISSQNIYIDTQAPVINTKVYVENALKTGRYTTGKEVLIQVTTSEAIQVNYEELRIKVSFSESGVGKYNYTKDPETVGYAKCKNAKINVDGTTTWIYSYQIQEGDEGDIQLEYKAGKITDLAGNETDIKELYTPQTSTGNAISGNSWNNELSVTYEFYKNSISEENKVTANTYFTEADDLIAVATFNKVLYVHYGLSDGKNTNVRLTNLYKDRVPSLYLNGDSKLKNTSVTVSTKNDSTIINYTFDMKSYDINALTNIEKVILKNENNNETVSTNETTAATNGLIPFAAEWYSTYKSDDEGNYETVSKNAINTTNDIQHIILDPIGVSKNIEQSDIYADTTAPTVKIDVQKIENETATDITNSITNANKIKYTFTWSEELAKEEGRTFEASDITVNNGIKGELIQDASNPKVYIMEIVPNVTSGNIGDVQVIVEKGACQDLVAHENVRAENIITVDKQSPTVEITADKDYVKVDDIITYTFNWSEAVKDFGVEVKAQEATESTPAIEAKAGIKVDNANVVENGFTKVNDSQYTLQVKPTNGNDVEVIVNKGICTDIAGNENISNKHIIQVIPSLTISTNRSNPTNEGEITYTFTWSEKVEGFTYSDIIVNEKAIKGELIDIGNNTSTMTVNYDSIIPNGNEGEVTISVPENSVQDSNGNGNAYTTNTTKIDRIAPIFISLEAYAESTIKVDENVDTVKEYYKAGDTIKVIATFSENIANSKIPNLTLQFSESGNAKGTIRPVTINGNKITYTYQIVDGDMGTLSVKGYSGEVNDIAGNITKVTKKTLDGDTIIVDNKAPILTGITAIAPDFEYDELLTNPEDTKRYGVESKTRDKNTITIIAEYSENVYKLDGTTIKNIENGKAPILKLKFGNSATRTAIFSKIEGSKIYYTYDIASGDNGDLSIVSLNGTVSDIAGNTVTTNNSLSTVLKYESNIAEENKVEKVTADTRKPELSISTTAVDKDDNGNTITGNASYYRKGSIITITATINEYVYNNNKNLQLFTSATAPELNINFATNGSGNGTCTNVEYKNNQTIFTYEYEIKANDNGALTVSIVENLGYDVALNGNSAKTQSISTIIADTVNPVTNWQSWVESEQYGIEDLGNGTWRVTFSEPLYTYNPDTHTVGSGVNTSSAPILLVSKDNVTPLETRVSSVTTNNGKTVITYTYSPYTKNIGAYGMKFANVSDKAGNLFNYKDQQAPTLSNIKVTSPVSGTYKAGTEITIVATFSEKITGTAPTLALQFSESGNTIGQVSAGTIDSNKIIYTYTIKAGDNGILSLKSYTGSGLKDLSDNSWTAPGNITLSGNSITADTIAPELTITSDVERTNADKVTYTFTWSEDVDGFEEEDIEVINGLKGTFTKVNKKVYTLEVETTNEGRQIVKVNANVCTDKAGNLNEQRVTYNEVVIDYTKPTIRAKVNGGNYVLDTDTQKSKLYEKIVVNEEVSKFEYIWWAGTELPTSGFTTITPETIQINSDINISTEVDEEGTYYLYIKVTDLAGNETIGKTDPFVVNNSEIGLTADKTNPTNEDVKVTISYGNGLTENRKAGVQGKTQSADSTIVIVSENGTVYVEATDVAGNKVYNTLEVKNIDKIPPTAEITYVTNDDNSVTATITLSDGIVTNNDNKTTYTFTENGEFTFEFEDAVGNKGTATAKVTWISKKTEEPTQPENPTVEDNKAPVITAISNGKEITVNTEDTDVDKYIITQNNTKPNAEADGWQESNKFNVTSDGTYYVWAKDTSGNVSYGYKIVIDTEGPIINNATYSNGKITIQTKDVGTKVEYVTISNSTSIPTMWTEIGKETSGEWQVGNITVTSNGTYYIWAKDASGNVSRYANTIEVTGFGGKVEISVVDYSVIATPDQSQKYIIVSPNTTPEELLEKITVKNGSKNKLSITDKVDNNGLKTTSLVKYDGDTEYIVVVKGDMNCDGKVTLIDLIKANAVRINGSENNLTKAKLLAVDLNNTGKIELRDIMSINRVRINSNITQ